MKVKSVIEWTAPEIDFSNDIMLIKWSEKNNPIYYRYLDKYNLTELCIDRKDGRLCNVKIVTISQDNVSFSNFINTTHESNFYIPIFDLGKFDSHSDIDYSDLFIDNPFPIGVDISQSELGISFSDKPHQKIAQSDGKRIIISPTGNLIWLSIEVSPMTVIHMKDWLNIH